MKRGSRLRGDRQIRSRVVIIALALIAVLVPATVAAHGFGTSASPAHYIANTGNITHGSSETNSAHRAALQDHYLWEMEIEYEYKTALSAAQTSATTAYLYWFVTPLDAGADAACVAYQNQSHNPPICERARVRHREQTILTASEDSKLQGVCHEIGHTLGFSHGGPATGCMGGGTPNRGVTSQHEIDHINLCYGMYLC